MTEPSHAVFLSYASQDAAAAQKICDALRASGIEVWFDRSELRGGDAWDRQIRKQIHDCALFIPLISQHSQERLEGYFRLEWKLAVDRSHRMAAERSFIVPVVVDSTRERDALVPESFRDVQWTNLPGGDTSPAFVARVSALLGAPTPVATANRPATALASAPLAQTPSRRNLWIVLGLTALTILVGGGWFAWQGAGLHRRSEAGLAGRSQPAATEKSIAVLSFLDLSEKHDQEYFADGMAEEILNLLVKVPGLKVIGRTSSFQFKGKTEDLRKVGEILGAVYVVEGSVRRSGDHVRVTAQLIDTRDGTHRWSETYDRDAKDAIGVQDAVAAAVTRALEIEIASPSSLPRHAASLSAETYDTYLRGIHAADRYDQSGLEEAASEFRRVLELNPSFVPAAEWLATVQEALAEWHFVPPQTGWEETRTAAAAVLKLDPHSAIAHAILSLVHTEYDWDWAAAEREFKLGLDTSPRNPIVLEAGAVQCLATGEWSKGLRFLDTALATDPLDPSIYAGISLIQARLGQLADAERSARRLLDISPTFGWARYWLGIVLLAMDRPGEALHEVARETGPHYQAAGLAAAYYALHETKEGDAELARLEAMAAKDSPIRIAEVYAMRGHSDEAFLWLDRAFAQKDASLYYVKGNLPFRQLFGDPRYKALLRKMKLSE